MDAELLKQDSPLTSVGSWKNKTDRCEERGDPNEAARSIFQSFIDP